MKKLRYIFCGLLFLIPSVGFSLTLSDIETIVRRNIRDTGDGSSNGPQRYSDTVLDALINEGQTEVVNQTWCLKTSTSITLVAGTTYYSLPSNLISIYQVTLTDIQGSHEDLEELSEDNVYQANIDFENSAANTPSEYFTRYSTSGENAMVIGFNPPPGSGSTGTVRAYYYNQTTDMSSDSDVPFDGTSILYPYHYTLVSYATLRVKLMEGKADEAQVYSALFESQLQIMNDRFRNKPNYTPSIKAAPR